MKITLENDFDNVTRLVVVDNKRGRVYDKWDVQIEAQLQDDGKTLKVFVYNRQK